MVLFLGGGAIGHAMAQAFAPGSWLAEIAGLFALPLAFAAGLQVWYGLALLSLIPRLVAALRTRKLDALRGPGRRPAGLPGSFVFLPLSSIAGLVAGLLVGLASPTHSVWLVTLLFWVVGSAHGALAWALARAGILVPPESV